MKFHITGKAKKVKKEAVRAILVACDAILTYHNFHYKRKTIKVRLVSKEYIRARATLKTAVGLACYSKNELLIANCKNLNSTITIIIHEMFHFYIWKNGEKITSTLVNRLKDDIVTIANTLTQNCYKRAGYFAHIKISYPPAGDDYYDNSQYDVSEEMIESIMLRKESA